MIDYLLNNYFFSLFYIRGRYIELDKSNGLILYPILYYNFNNFIFLILY